jgi:hypothetical protein
MTFPVPGGATFLRSRSNLADVANPATALADLGGLVMVAGTGIAGFALQNGTPTILSWTAPNDGLLHRVTLFGLIHVTSLETGGQVSMQYFGPFGGATAHTSTILAAGLAADTGGQAANFFNVPVGPGTTVTVAQTSALTAGAATLWAELWAL